MPCMGNDVQEYQEYASTVWGPKNAYNCHDHYMLLWAIFLWQGTIL